MNTTQPAIVKRVPNAKSAKAMKEMDEGKGKRFQTAEMLFKDLKI